MNKQRYIEQQIALGQKLHLHDGVWWRQLSPFHCKAALPFEPIAPGAARPSPWRALAGYSHVVPDAAQANSVVSVMLRCLEPGKPFTLEALSSSRRSKVRRGLKKNEVRRIADLEPLIEDVRQIVVSTRMRTGVGLPADYYVRRYDQWRHDMLALFGMEDRPWWGAFAEGRLVAYYQTARVDDTLSICAAKSHSDFLANYPNDALLYVVMEEAFNQMGCRCIEYGDWSAEDERLQYFKQSYGFAKHDYPEYVHLNPLARPVLRWRRERLRRRRAASAPAPAPADEQGKE